MIMRRVAACTAVCLLAVAGCGRSTIFDTATSSNGTSGDTAPPVHGSRPALVDGPTIDQAIADIQQFWTDNFGELSARGSFAPIAASRIFAARSGDQAGPCDGEFASYRKAIAGNAFAVDCRREGPMVAYDAEELMPTLKKRYGGLGPAIVLAHEWGHVAQFEAGIAFRNGVFAEQQADCFAGAWFAQAKDTFAELASKAALDRTIGALLEFRDEPGSSAGARQAHGSGFDRVRAFQEGYERSITFCAGYTKNPPTLTELPFSNVEDELNNGNLPYDDLKPLLIQSLNEFVLTLAPSLTTTQTVVDAATYTGKCNGAKIKSDSGPVHLCLEEGVIVLDDANLRAQEDEFGDGAVSVLFAIEWAEALRMNAGEKAADGSMGPFLQQLCLAGGWFRVLINPSSTTAALTFSPGDLDEALSILSAASEEGTLGEGELFEAVAAMRQGITQGGQSCGLGK